MVIPSFATRMPDMSLHVRSCVTTTSVFAVHGQELTFVTAADADGANTIADAKTTSMTSRYRAMRIGPSSLATRPDRPDRRYGGTGESASLGRVRWRYPATRS